jgi:hypothetical protein
MQKNYSSWINKVFKMLQRFYKAAILFNNSIFRKRFASTQSKVAKIVALCCQTIPRFYCKNNTYFPITVPNVYFYILSNHHNLFPRLKIRTTSPYPLVYCNNKK